MATKTLTVVRPGTYGTRMLKAGDSLECAGPDARLYKALGWATEAKPRKRADDDVLVDMTAPETSLERARQLAADKKAAPRKRARKQRKKTA